MGSEDGFSAPQFPAQESAWPGQGGQAAVNYQAVPQAQAPQYYQAVPQAQAPQQAVLPKNPALGVILSFFIPGVGSMVNGDATRGVIILVVYMVGWILAFFLIGIPILFGAWVWGLVDGYLSAQRWNLAHGIVS